MGKGVFFDTVPVKIITTDSSIAVSIALKKIINSTVTTSDLISGHMCCRVSTAAKGVSFMKQSQVYTLLSSCPR